MSAKIMGAVWDLNIDQGMKLVLLAYADHADHDGGNIFPSIAKIAEKTGYSERTVQRMTSSLAKEGYLIPITTRKGGRSGTTHWKIPFQNGKITKGDNLTPIKRVTHRTKRVTSTTLKGDIAMSPEPSLTVLTYTKFQQKEIVGILSDVTGIDYHIKSNVGRLAKRGSEILAAGYTPEQVKICFGPHGWWYKNDWRGKKNQRPRPEDITSLIKQAIEESFLVKRESEVVQIELPGGIITEAKT